MDEGTESDDRPVRWRFALAGFATLPLGALALAVGRSRPEWTERYSRSVFPPLRAALSAVAERLPFSLAQAVLALVILWTLARLVRGLRARRAGRRRLANLFAHAAAQAFGAAGLVYTVFLVVWGLNYARLPLAVHAGLVLAPISASELEALGAELAERCNALRAVVEPADCGPRGSGAEPRLEPAFAALARQLPILSGPLPPVRRPLTSPLLARLGISGVYSPFTGEAHVVATLPDVSVPFAICHEVAHALGFAREDEASFIAFLACRASGDPAFEYSGRRAALEHVLNALARRDPERALGLVERLEPGVHADRAEVRAYWRARAGWLAGVGRASNDLYLKAQGEAEGVGSYGRMVDLLVADFRARSE